MAATNKREKVKVISDARKRCYQEIVELASESLTHYYKLYPERLDDERAADAKRWSTTGIADVIAILDHYAIGELPKEPDA